MNLENLFTPDVRQQVETDFNAAAPRLAPFRSKIDAVLRGLDEYEMLCMKFCWANMPIQDLLSVSFELVLEIVRHTLKVVEADPSLRELPAEVFLSFLLFYRVNNEKIEFNRAIFYQELYPRIAGKSKKEAILEVNYWCGEHVTYRATDERTASPLTSIRRGYGRCGEESTFLVSALRSVGIPARQIYTPRWAHCDDNHAWVEAYADGEWYYLGACEPEPRLDKGWFTASASKAMLIQAMSFGSSFVNEEISSVTAITSRLNRTAKYGKTHRLTVRVIQDGEPVSGAKVRCEILNYAELYPLVTLETGQDGTASSSFGRGTLHLTTVSASRAAFALVSLDEERTVTLDLTELSGAKGYAFVQHPPLETVTGEDSSAMNLIQDGGARLKRCAASLEAFEAALSENPRLLEFRAGDAYDAAYEPYLIGARGNADELIGFLERPEYSVEEKLEILSTLREKDLVDLTAEMLMDALDSSRPVQARYPRDVYRSGILAPRVLNETLLPCRSELRKWADANGLVFDSVQSLYDYWTASIRIERDGVYPTLTARAIDVLTYGVADPLTFDAAFVEFARALTFAADLDPVTRVPRGYRDGAFEPLRPVSGADDSGKERAFRLMSTTGAEMGYYQNLTIQRFDGDDLETLDFGEAAAGSSLTVRLSDGTYRILTAVRQLDGSVQANVQFLRVDSSTEAEIRVTIPAVDDLTTFFRRAPVKSFEVTALNGGARMLPAMASGGEILAFVDVGAEPTEHFFNELLEAEEEIRERALSMTLIIAPENDLNQRTFQRVLAAFPSVRAGTVRDQTVESSLHQLMNAGDERRPFILALNSTGEVLYSFSNYNVGTVRLLIEILDAERSARTS